MFCSFIPSWQRSEHIFILFLGDLIWCVATSQDLALQYILKHCAKHDKNITRDYLNLYH